MATLTKEQANALAERIVAVNPDFSGKAVPDELTDFLKQFEKEHGNIFSLPPFADKILEEKDKKNINYQSFINVICSCVTEKSGILAFNKSDADEVIQDLLKYIDAGEAEEKTIIPPQVDPNDRLTKTIAEKKHTGKDLLNYNDIFESLQKFLNPTHTTGGDRVFVQVTGKDIEVTSTVALTELDSLKPFGQSLQTASGNLLNALYVPVNRGFNHWAFIKVVPQRNGKGEVTIKEVTYFDSFILSDVTKKYVSSTIAKGLSIEEDAIKIQQSSEEYKQPSGDGWSCGYRVIQGIVREIDKDLPVEGKLEGDAKLLIEAKGSENIRNCVVKKLLNDDGKYQEYLESLNRKALATPSTKGGGGSVPAYAASVSPVSDPSSASKAVGNMRELEKLFENGKLKIDSTYFLKDGSKAEDVDGGHRKYTLQICEKAESKKPGGKLICQTNGNKYNLEKTDDLTEFDIEALAVAALQAGHKKLRIDHARNEDIFLIYKTLKQHEKIELDTSNLKDELVRAFDAKIENDKEHVHSSLSPR